MRDLSTSDTVAILCAGCRRQLGHLCAGPGGELFFRVTIASPEGAVMAKPGQRRNNRTYDASPGSARDLATQEVARYRFVCRHRSATMPTLDKPLRAETFREPYEQASTTPGGRIVITLDGLRVATGRRG